MSTHRKVNRFFKRLSPDWDKATETFPELPDLVVDFDDEAGTEGRAFAFYDPADQAIMFSQRIVREPAHRQRGIFRHELGHLVHDVYGREKLEPIIDSDLPASDERLADVIALFIFAEPVLYDDETVQSIKHGEPIRPEHLG